MEERETYNDDGGEASRLGRVTGFNYLGKCSEGSCHTRDSRITTFEWEARPSHILVLILPENKYKKFNILLKFCKYRPRG